MKYKANKIKPDEKYSDVSLYVNIASSKKKNNFYFLQHRIEFVSFFSSDIQPTNVYWYQQDSDPVYRIDVISSFHRK